MKLKTIEVNGGTYAEVADGKPVYIGDDSKEIPFDAPHTVGTIKRLNDEAKSHREAKEAAEARLKGFEGIADPEAARKALDRVKNFSDADFVKADKVDEMKRAWENTSKEEREAAVRASNAERDKWKGEAESLQGALFGEKVGGAFSRSKFIADKIAIPADLLQDKFGARFKVTDGKIVGHGADNQPIYSRTRAGEIADFDEALESMIDAYPHKNAILKGTGANGSGARPPHGGGANGQRTMNKSAFDALPLPQQAALMRGKDAPVLVD